MVRNRLLLGIVLLFTMLFFSLQTAYAEEVIFAEDFESGWGEWYADNGVWEVGTPTAGPHAAHGGENCAGTVLNGNYPDNTNSRLISPILVLPGLTGAEGIHLRFWHWFSYSNYNYHNYYNLYDKGHVQISVFDEDTGTWSEWDTLSSIQEYSPVWSLKDVDITAYADQQVRIAFYHTESRNYRNASVSTGWYIDDVSVVKKIPQWSGDFESGWDDWSAENGLWEVGFPTAGPDNPHGGFNCAGTVLGGNYPNFTDSRLISPILVLPGLTGAEGIHLRFWHWFSYSNYNYHNYYNLYDKGHVQISVFDEDTGTWSEWDTLSSIQEYSPVWSLKDVDITAYADQQVRIAFYHTESRNYRNASVSTGWYIDDVSVVKKIPQWSGDFESGWDDWSAENGLWEVGFPTAGPDNPHGGFNCAGTVLGGNYPNFTDSRLISPILVLPGLTGAEGIHLRFWHWFSYSNYNYHNYYNLYDKGHVQISVFDEDTGTWSEWDTLSSIQEYSPVWSLKDVDITAYADQQVRIAFYHTESRNYRNASVSTGWYIDDVSVVKKIPQWSGDFESGWDDWSAENGLWEVGFPTAGPDNPHGGFNCAGTVLGGNYPNFTDSRLISPILVLPGLTGAEGIHLRFWHWFSYSNYNYHNYYNLYDKGHVQISVFDEDTGTWSEWDTLSSIQEYSPVWSLKDVDITAYADQQVRIAFYHTESRNYRNASVSTGWYIDDIHFPYISPVIDSISFTGYFPPPCTSTITVSAHDPCEGNLTYNWDAPDGGEIIGTGAEVEFVPPATQFEPYTVRVSVTSDLTHISSFVKVIQIYTEVANDDDGDGDIDGSDLADFAVDYDSEVDDLARFAEEFGMVACQ